MALCPSSSSCLSLGDTTPHPGFVFISLSEFSKEDMAKSLLHMISNDIGQLACLYAKLHGLDRVYFGGFFIRGHPVTMRTITYSINFFSKVTAAVSCPWVLAWGQLLPLPPAHPWRSPNMAACRPKFISCPRGMCKALGWDSHRSLPPGSLGR